MRTHCVGRYLIDLPESFAWAETPDATLYYGLDADHKTVDVRIIDCAATREEFIAGVTTRAREIASEENEVSGESMLVRNEELKDGNVLLRYFDSTLSDSYHRHEIHVFLQGVHVMLAAASFEGMVEPVEQRLKKLSSQISLIESSNGPGLCLGPVRINADHDHEEISTYARDKRRPDVLFSVYMSAITPDQEEGLIDQIEREKEALATPPKFLRKGATELGGMKAEEALMRFNEDGITMHSFAIWSKRREPSFEHPTITLSLSTGGELPGDLRPPDPLRYGIHDEDTPHELPARTVTSSLGDEEAMSMWDAIVRTVRLRPDALSK